MLCFVFENEMNLNLISPKTVLLFLSEFIEWEVIIIYSIYIRSIRPTTFRRCASSVLHRSTGNSLFNLRMSLTAHSSFLFFFCLFLASFVIALRVQISFTYFQCYNTSRLQNFCPSLNVVSVIRSAHLGLTSWNTTLHSVFLQLIMHPFFSLSFI